MRGDGSQSSAPGLLMNYTSPSWRSEKHSLMATMLSWPHMQMKKEGSTIQKEEKKIRVPLPVEGAKVLSRQDNNVHITAYNVSFKIQTLHVPI